MAIEQDDILEVSARMEFNGVEDIVNVYQFQLTTPGPITDQQGVDDVLLIIEAIYTALVALQSTLTLYRDIRVTNKTQLAILGTFLWPSLTAGTAAVIAQAPGVCGLVSLATAVPRVNLRKYYGDMVTSTMELDGTFASFVTTALTTISGTLLTQRVQVNGTWRYGYLSPKSLAWELPLSAVVTDIPAYQRRRKQGRGS